MFTQDPQVWHGGAQHALARRDPRAGADALRAGRRLAARRGSSAAAGSSARCSTCRRWCRRWQATIAFVFLFNPATGPVNKILGSLGLPSPLWFNDPAWAKPSLVLLGLWGIGDLMIIFLASLLDVPTEQYEAAALDGANPRQRFRYVTLPDISPVLMFAAITGVIADAAVLHRGGGRRVGRVSGQATTGGGSSSLLGYPEGSTLTYAQWLYSMGFKNFYLGYASALAVVMFVVALGVHVLLLRRVARARPRTGAV